MKMVQMSYYTIQKLSSEILGPVLVWLFFQENQIRLRAAFLEKDNMRLRNELLEVRQELHRLKVIIVFHYKNLSVCIGAIECRVSPKTSTFICASTLMPRFDVFIDFRGKLLNINIPK